MYAIRSYYVMILNKEGSVIKSQGYRFERLTTRDETECEEYIASQERYAGLRITSYNVCYTKLLRLRPPKERCVRGSREGTHAASLI